MPKQQLRFEDLGLDWAGEPDSPAPAPEPPVPALPAEMPPEETALRRADGFAEFLSDLRARWPGFEEKASEQPVRLEVYLPRLTLGEAFLLQAELAKALRALNYPVREWEVAMNWDDAESLCGKVAGSIVHRRE